MGTDIHICIISRSIAVSPWRYVHVLSGKQVVRRQQREPLDVFVLHAHKPDARTLFKNLSKVTHPGLPRVLQLGRELAICVLTEMM